MDTKTDKQNNVKEKRLIMKIEGFLKTISLTAIVFLLWANAATTHAGSQFNGVEITVGVMNASAIGGPARAHAKTWEQKTGGRVKVLQFSFIELFDEFMNSLSAKKPKYDVILYAPAWAGDFFPYLSKLPNRLAEDESFDDIHPTYRDRLMKWDGKWIAVTIDGDLFNGYYRRDLFEDSRNREDFLEKYGYDLAAPHTWKQYFDIAEFFTGRTGPDGQKLYGTAEAFARGGQQFWDVFSRASAYTNHPDYPGSQFFDPETMKAQINNPGWVRAVEEYVDILRFCPPDAKDYGIVEVRRAFVDGRTAMALDWGDTGQISADPHRSAIKDKVGYFVLPGTNETWNYKTGKWDRMDTTYKAPFLAFGGWVGSVPKNSRKKAAAWNYIMWYASPENSLHDVVTSGTGINPYRFTHFTNIDAWTRVFSRRAASEYLGVLRASMDSPSAALDLRIPGFHDYTEALEIQLTRALNKELSVKKALNLIATQWERITDMLGRGKQLAIYRSSMGLPPSVSSRAKKRSFVIGFSQATTTEPWRIMFNKQLRAEAARHPEIKLVVRDGKDRVSKQTADVEEFIRMGVDAILISPKVAKGLTPVANKAFDAGIPVIVLDRDLANDRYTQFIGGDNKLIGRWAGKYAVKLLGGAGKAQGNVVEIWGGMASTPAQDRHDGFHEIIDKEPGIRMLIEPRDGDWKQDKSYEIMADALDNHPEIDLVYAHNDPMAYGAYLAAKEVGREKETAFLGINGIPAEGVKWIDEGILTATFLYKTPGDEGIRQALKLLKGRSIKKRVTLPTMTIDRENAEKILRANGIVRNTD